MKRLLFILLTLLLVETVISCKSKKDLVDSDANNFSDVMMVVDHAPIFSGGDVSAWVGSQLKYPKQEYQNRIEGRVYIKFIIDKNGEVTYPEVFRSSGNKALDTEALRVVSKMPSWSPGRKNGKKVRVYYTVPIKFSLR